MNAIVCELCGSNDIQKQDDFFVCQHCGTKYSLEEAKKLIGVVKIDNSERLSNMYQVARRFCEQQNYVEAEKSYSKILEYEPNSWEAVYYSTYCKAMESNIANIASSVNMLARATLQALMLIKDINSTAEQEQAIQKVALTAMDASISFVRSATECYGSLDPSMRREYKGEFLARMNACVVCLCVLGDTIAEQFPKKEPYSMLAVAAWDGAINLCSALYDSHGRIKEYRDTRDKYIAKQEEYTGKQREPVASSSGGCYVATAVYGSYDCPEVWTLRRFRDYTLASTWYGRAFIHIYYAVSPTLVKWFGNADWFRSLWKPRLDKMVMALNVKGVPDTPYNN